MLIVPLLLGSVLSLFGVTGATKLAIVLQMAMPPAFATLVIAEVYNLDRDLSVTALAVGSGGLLVTLPIWLWLFS
jgi:predicted permease